MDVPLIKVVGGYPFMFRFSFLLACAMTLTACGGSSSNSGDSSDSDSDRSVELTPVSIQFDAVVGSEALVCDTDYDALGAASSSTQIKDFRMFVHSLELVSSDGDVVPVTLSESDWQAQGVALLDFENATGECTGTAETNSLMLGTIPESAASYTGIRFVVGVPAELNHLEQTSVSPFNVSGMNWGWTNGYKFIRFDVVNWNIHIGATGCAANGSGVIECSNANRPAIELDNFDYTSQQVQIDFAALVQGSDISTDLGGASGCMSGGTDPECNEIFTQLGLNLASGDNDASLVQAVFSVAD